MRKGEWWPKREKGVTKKKVTRKRGFTQACADNGCGKGENLFTHNCCHFYPDLDPWLWILNGHFYLQINSMMNSDWHIELSWKTLDYQSYYIDLWKYKIIKNIMIIDVTINMDCWWIQGDIVSRKKICTVSFKTVFFIFKIELCKIISISLNVILKL